MQDEFIHNLEVIPSTAAFGFKTAATVNLTMAVEDPSGNPVSGALVRVLAGGSTGAAAASSSALLFQGMTAANGTVEGTFTVQQVAPLVTVQTTAGDQSDSVTLNAAGAAAISGAVVTPSAIIIDKADQDGDGVPDSSDAYPTDPTRASMVRVPADGYAILAFEDLYPAPGDADFNDYAARIRHEVDLDPFGRMIRVRGYYEHVAKAAGYDHELMLSITAARGADLTVAHYDANGVLLSDTTSSFAEAMDLPITANSATTLSQSNAGQGQTPVAGHQFHFEVELSGPISLYGPPDATLDVYLAVLDTGEEIHLAGMHFDANGEDLYLDANGFPWALMVPGDFRWPYEGGDIHDAYPLFDDWYVSGGTSNVDWYSTFDDGLVFPITP